MFAVLLTAIALAASESPSTGSGAVDQRGEGMYRLGLGLALPGMVLDAVDRPSWRADDDIKAVGAVGRLASYGGLGTMAFGAMKSRGALSSAARNRGERNVPGLGLVAGSALLGVSAGFDLATMGSFPRASTPRALSATAAAARIGALVALTAQGSANATARGTPVDGAGGVTVSVGLHVAPGRAGIVAVGRF